MNSPSTFRRVAASSLLAACVGALLVACGGDRPAAPVVPAADSAPRSPGADFTAAVPVGSTGTGARVGFRLAARPVIGEPLEVVVRVTATEALDRLAAGFETEGDLTLAAETSTLTVDGMNAGDEQLHTLRVVPVAEGAAVVKVMLQTETPRGSTANEFAIPLLVTAPAEAPADAAPGAAPAPAP